jgi:hypothetical protein
VRAVKTLLRSRCDRLTSCWASSASGRLQCANWPRRQRYHHPLLYSKIFCASFLRVTRYVLFDCALGRDGRLYCGESRRTSQSMCRSQPPTSTMPGRCSLESSSRTFQTLRSCAVQPDSGASCIGRGAASNPRCQGRCTGERQPLSLVTLRCPGPLTERLLIHVPGITRTDWFEGLSITVFLCRLLCLMRGLAMIAAHSGGIHAVCYGRSAVSADFDHRH